MRRESGWGSCTILELSGRTNWIGVLVNFWPLKDEKRSTISLYKHNWQTESPGVALMLVGQCAPTATRNQASPIHALHPNQDRPCRQVKVMLGV